MGTIRDLARRAGVSVATVSRALNNYPDINDDTRQKILELAREMNYRASAAARSLVTRRSYVVGAIFNVNTDLMHPFFQEVLVGFKRELSHAGFDLLFFTQERGGPGPFTFLERCRHRQVDGVVLVGVDRQNSEILDLVTSGIPCMSIDLDLVGRRAGYIMSDNTSGVIQAVRHLYDLGHRRIAYLSGMAVSRPGHDRLVGYRQALSQLNLPYVHDYVPEGDGDFSWAGGYMGMQQLVDLPNPPTAVVAAADLMAIGAMRAARDRGVRIPDDIAIVGYDDIALADMVTPGLTTIRQDKGGLGSEAACSLVRMIEDPAFTPPILTMPVELVIRESCGFRR